MTKPRSSEPAEIRPEIPDLLPVLPLKDAVLFPYIILPLSVSSESHLEAIDRALADQRTLFVVAQRDPTTQEPQAGDLHRIGTAAAIMRMLKLPDGRIRILVQGLARASLENISQTSPYLMARVEEIVDAPSQTRPPGLEVEALIRAAKENLERIVSLGKNISGEVMVIASNLDDPGRLADLTASNLELKVAEGQAVLETLDPVARLERVNELLLREVQVLTMQQAISSQAREEMDKSQREYFLRQQLKAIHEELGESDETAAEIAAYRKSADDKGMPAQARDEMERQIRRLERSHPESAETSLLRTYLDWLTGLPWAQCSVDNLDIEHARKVLDEDHFDLEKVKERILEHLAVQRLRGGDTRGPILCFVGPPGVGKTSLGRSIARALGREFVRLSLGGVRDEAEIRGHRRTYVGSLPGRIVQGIHQARTSNPVFMLDEIDKLGSDYRGDPSSALLEVLDPAHNSAFTDHYLGVSYDLSKVLFITTANLLEPIQPAFLDRLELIPLTGYTEDEKLVIARRHLIPKLMAEHGLSEAVLTFNEAAIRRVISEYTKEAGLRGFSRELARICRKVAVRVAGGGQGRDRIGAKEVGELLGPAKHYSEELLQSDRIGVATGLAWTAAGGDLMFIEVVAIPGKGELLLTGQLGEVMKESAQAAMSFARSYAAAQGVPRSFFAEHDFHVHVPAGSIPKDGPSAGITIATAIVSVLTGRPVYRKLAMTGEITLRGDVLPIGGIREKVMAARLAGVREVILPKLNERDLVEVPAPIKKGLRFHYAEHVDQVLERALARRTKARAAR